MLYSLPCSSTRPQSAEQVTLFCRQQLEHSDDDAKPAAQLTTAQRLRKVILELVDTERSYVKVQTQTTWQQKLLRKPCKLCVYTDGAFCFIIIIIIIIMMIMMIMIIIIVTYRYAVLPADPVHLASHVPVGFLLYVCSALLALDLFGISLSRVTCLSRDSHACVTANQK